jgi:hypothetical protein
MSLPNDMYQDLAAQLDPYIGEEDTAIHDNVANEIHAITAKATPVNADELLIEDSAAAWAKKSITITSLPVIHRSVNSEISAVAAKASPIAADYLLIEDSAASNAKKSITIGTLPVAAAQVARGIREIANDGAVALVSTDDTIIIANSTTGTKSITTSSSYAGQIITIRLVLCTGNSYTLALVSGTLTFNAAEEGAIIVRNAANSGWLVSMLNGATIV